MHDEPGIDEVVEGIGHAIYAISNVIDEIYLIEEVREYLETAIRYLKRARKEALEAEEV